MKKILFSLITVFTLLTVAPPESIAGGHLIGGNRYTSANATWLPAGWSVYRLQYTFGAAVTDTAFFFLGSGHPNAGYADTLIDNIVTTIIADDSTNIQWEVWSASDTTKFWSATIGSTYNPKLFKITAIGRDSATTGTITRVINLGSVTYNGWLPYKILVGYGHSAATGGTANSIGNVLRVDAIKP